MDKVKGFDIPVDDMDRAVAFYRGLFGWEAGAVPGSSGGFHSLRTVPVDDLGEPAEPGSINGGLYQRGTHGLAATFLEVRVGSIDEVLARLPELGGSVVRGKSPMLDFAYFAVIRDSEGNLLGLWEDR